MYGGCLLAAVGLYFKPDTSITTKAYEEAKRRLEARGEMPTYTPTPPEPWYPTSETRKQE